MEKETINEANKLLTHIEYFEDRQSEIRIVQQLIMSVGRNMTIGSVMDDEDWIFIETHRKLVNDYLKLFNRGFGKLSRDTNKKLELL